MLENYRTNFPHLDPPPDSWLELTDEERERATCAPSDWKSGILPPDEFQRYLRG